MYTQPMDKSSSKRLQCQCESSNALQKCRPARSKCIIQLKPVYPTRQVWLCSPQRSHGHFAPVANGTEYPWASAADGRLLGIGNAHETPVSLAVRFKEQEGADGLPVVLLVSRLSFPCGSRSVRACHVEMKARELTYGPRRRKLGTQPLNTQLTPSLA